MSSSASRHVDWVVFLPKFKELTPVLNGNAELQFLSSVPVPIIYVHTNNFPSQHTLFRHIYKIKFYYRVEVTLTNSLYMKKHIRSSLFEHNASFDELDGNQAVTVNFKLW